MNGLKSWSLLVRSGSIFHAVTTSFKPSPLMSATIGLDTCEEKTAVAGR